MFIRLSKLQLNLISIITSSAPACSRLPSIRHSEKPTSPLLPNAFRHVLWPTPQNECPRTSPRARSAYEHVEVSSLACVGTPAHNRLPNLLDIRYETRTPHP